MPAVLAAIELSFDPLLHLGQLTLRWQTIGVTLAVLAALAVAALMAPDHSARRPLLRSSRARTPPDLRPRFPPAPSIEPPRTVASGQPLLPLRLDHMVLIVAGSVPGAVLGGRLVHVISFWDAYAAAPLRALDPSVGTLSLLGAVIGGLVSGAYVAHLIGAPLRRWADAAAVPLLLAIGLGKLSQLLGGSGQGLPFDGPWAIAFTGDHPWVSTNPGLPSHPSQVYEALWVLVGIPFVLLWAGPPRRPPRLASSVAWTDRAAEEGRLFVGALSWFLLGRVLIGFTWRDDPALGPLNTEQVMALAAMIGLQVAARFRTRPRLLLPAP